MGGKTLFMMYSGLMAFPKPPAKKALDPPSCHPVPPGWKSVNCPHFPPGSSLMAAITENVDSV